MLMVLLLMVFLGNNFIVALLYLSQTLRETKTDAFSN